MASLQTLDELVHEINYLKFVAELMLYRDQIGDQSFHVGDNRARTHIVKHAYEMSLQFGSPKLTTTPGSDFSLLCSLLFELATGISDESLAGAINKFSRSTERQQIDRNEDMFRYENSDEGMAERESDNFADVKSEAETLAAEENFWQNMFSSRKWDDNFRYQIRLRFLNAQYRKKTILEQHGPFLVWASQISRKTHIEYTEKIETDHLKLLELAIEIGQRRRAERS